MKIVYFDYAAVFVLVCMFLTGFLKKRIKGTVNRSFYRCMLVTLITAIAGSMAVTLDNIGPGFPVEKFFAHMVYLAGHGMTLLYFLSYLVTITDTWYRIKKYVWLNIAMFIPTTLLCLLLVINIFTGSIFYLDEAEVYTRGGLFFIVYVIAAYYMALNIAYIWFFRKLFSKAAISALVFLYSFMILAVVLEYIFPNLVIELFCNALGGLVIAMTIQSPEEKMDYETGLFNLTAYMHDSKIIFQNRKPMYEIIVNVPDFRKNLDTLGMEIGNRFSRELANRIETICSETNLSEELYYLKDGRFRCHVDADNSARINIATRRMYAELRRPFVFGNVSMCLNPYICIANVLEDFERVEDMMNFGRKFGEREDATQIMEARNLLKDNYYQLVQKIDRIIDSALTNNEFRVFYQPIYSVKEQRYISAEALLRLKHPDYGFISPEFIVRSAEKSGTIHKIGEYVLRTVCNFITSDDFKALGLEYIEVNLSAAQCIQDSLDKNIEEMLKDYGVRPDQINLEITETAMIQSEKRMADNLKKLSQMGIRFSLDDFGSGYSNIQRISTLPLDIVKIDRSFIHENSENRRLDIILENMVRMIRELDLRIVVEGVETAETLKIFEKLGCDYIQGYYFSKPLPEEEFMKKVLEKNGVCFFGME